MWSGATVSLFCIWGIFPVNEPLWKINVIWTFIVEYHSWTSHFTQMVLQSQLGNTPAYYFPGIWEFKELLKGKLYSFCNKAECSCSLHMNSTNGINVNFIECSKIVVIITPVKYSTREKRRRIVSQCFILSTWGILEKIQKWVWKKKKYLSNFWKILYSYEKSKLLFLPVFMLWF